jgi:hypothetical protein
MPSIFPPTKKSRLGNQSRNAMLWEEQTPPFLEENGGVRLCASISVRCAVVSGRLFFARFEKISFFTL